MITNGVLSALAGAVAALLGVIPGFTLPDWLQAGHLNCGWPVGAGSGHELGCHSMWLGSKLILVDGWLPVAGFLQCATFIGVCAGVAIGIRLARMAVSLISGGGGSAA